MEPNSQNPDQEPISSEKPQTPYPAGQQLPSNQPQSPDKQPVASNKLKVLSVIGLVFALLLPPIGLCISLVAYIKYRRQGIKDKVALIGVVLGTLLTIIFAFGFGKLPSTSPKSINNNSDRGPGSADSYGKYLDIVASGKLETNCYTFSIPINLYHFPDKFSYDPDSCQLEIQVYTKDNTRRSVIRFIPDSSLPDTVNSLDSYLAYLNKDLGGFTLVSSKKTTFAGREAYVRELRAVPDGKELLTTEFLFYNEKGFEYNGKTVHPVTIGIASYTADGIGDELISTLSDRWIWK